MKNLGGHDAVARLERRGGKIEVLPRGRGAAYSGHHLTYAYHCAGRENGATVVVGLTNSGCSEPMPTGPSWLATWRRRGSWRPGRPRTPQSPTRSCT